MNVYWGHFFVKFFVYYYTLFLFLFLKTWCRSLILLINIVYYYKIMCFILNVMPLHLYVILYCRLLLLFSLLVLCI